MRLKERWIVGVYSYTSLQEVEVAFVLTDGLDILKVLVLGRVSNSFLNFWPIICGPILDNIA